ncbi:MAG: CvpA family protein [Bacteroidia bacterium]|jgi:membrane protein required for colicin V production|nr:CvpA family protein [Bacteroidia bacterium]
MSNIDISILIIVGAGFVFGLFKGLVRELASLAAIVLGIYGAKLFSSLLVPLVVDMLGVSEKVAQPLSYVVLFIAIAVALLILARTVDKVFDAVSLGGLNKFLGGVFGALKYALIISVLINVFEPLNQKFRFMSEEKQQNSVTYRPLLNLAPDLWDEATQYRHESEAE